MYVYTHTFQRRSNAMQCAIIHFKKNVDITFDPYAKGTYSYMGLKAIFGIVVEDCHLLYNREVFILLKLPLQVAK